MCALRYARPRAAARSVKLGIDPKTLAGIVNTSTGRCWSSDTYNPCPGVIDTAPASRGYTGGFGSALMRKDLKLAADAAAGVGAPIPVGEVRARLHQRAAQHRVARFGATHRAAVSRRRAHKTASKSSPVG